jgi:hypothetical protein
MKKCNYCQYRGSTWLQDFNLEIFCPNCKIRQKERFVEAFFNDRGLSYSEAIKLYDSYEESFIWHNANTKTTWAELDVVLNESISRSIRKLSAKDKLA